MMIIRWWEDGKVEYLQTKIIINEWKRKLREKHKQHSSTTEFRTERIFIFAISISCVRAYAWQRAFLTKIP